MEPEERKRFTSVITAIIQHNAEPDVYQWLEEKAALIGEEKGGAQLNLAFAAVPRKTGRHIIKLTEDESEGIAEVYKLFSIDDWTIDRLGRVWLLMQVDDIEKDIYLKKIEDLFKGAEMNELAALYSSLFFLAFPEEWIKQCAEGIRSNIGLVLEAIMYNNPYTVIYLDDLAWNQLVMKAFFTDKDVKRIIGLDERANKELALILVDYANERWSAHRTVNPQLWRLVSSFIDETNFENIEKAFKGGDSKEKQAAALACFYSNYPPAKNLLDNDQDLKSNIQENKLNWDLL